MLLARFGSLALLPASLFAKTRFKTGSARALFMGIAAHANCNLNLPATASIGLVLQLAAHVSGWPLPEGGSQAIANALANYFQSLGGRLHLQNKISNLNELPDLKAPVLFDLSPHQIATLLEGSLSALKLRAFERYKPGRGVCKVDWALSGSIPWTNPVCKKAATLHLGGSFNSILQSENDENLKVRADNFYILLAQQSLFDVNRAPVGAHTAWAYCHVPFDSNMDCADQIEAEIEKYAPGFRSLILGRKVMATKDLEIKNENLRGGDISGGAVSLRQLLFRPTVSLDPYVISSGRYYICSSSAPPGPGIHGMCGYNAAKSLLNDFNYNVSTKRQQKKTVWK